MSYSLAERLILACREHRKLTPNFLSLSWLAFSLSSLVTSGILSFPLLVGRLMGFTIPSELFYRIIVVHTDTSTVLWFGGFMCALLTLTIPSAHRIVKTLLYLASSTAWAGLAIILFAAIATYDGNPIPSDYLPVIDSPVFLLGLSLLMTGMALTISLACIYGVLLVRVYGVAFNASLLSIPLAILINGNYIYAAWIFGHMFQLVNIISFMIIWAYMLDIVDNPSGSLFTASALIALTGIFAMYYLIILNSGDFTLFTYGKIVVASVSISLLTLGALHILKGAHKRGGFLAVFSRPPFSYITASLLLLLIGGVVGFIAYYRGGLIITSHYHFTLNSLTTMLMAGTYYLLNREGALTIKRVRIQPLLYSYGVLVMASGLLLAGFYGAPRKVVSALMDLPVELKLQLLLGSSLTVLGALLYVLNSLMLLMRNRS